MSDAAILVEDLEKRFGEIPAVDGVTFEVTPGTVYGLLGPNGAGKTTTLRVLATILVPDAGRAEVFGHDVVREAEEVRRSIGLAGQNAAVDPNLTGMENLRMVGKLSQLAPSEIPRRSAELLERFDLIDAADRPVRTYSGGMRRRLDVAASLVANPPVLFLDEPTTGLDIQTRSELWEMLRELVAEGTTVLLTTQYLEEADRLSSRIAVIDHGRVIAEDTPTALKSSLGSTVIELTFVDESGSGRAADLLRGVEGAEPEREGTLVRMASAVGAHLLLEELKRLEAAGLEPAGISVHEPSLDDVFLRLTGHRAEEPSESGETAVAERVGG
ncbi:MAG: ATP-binding cassette domain-containing protein [Actinomycetota bacterium]